jgi:hypothetical protein
MKKKALSNLGLDITKLILYFLCFHFNLKGLKEYAMFFLVVFLFPRWREEEGLTKVKRKRKRFFSRSNSTQMR